MAFLQLNMTKERTELKHKINSLVDPLSGVANRRAFLDGAAGFLARQEAEHEPLAMLLFDLDHFKQINDRFGHAIGDMVLQTFAGTATATLGADMLFARIGGEEFASCMPVGDLDEAYRHCRSGAAQFRRRAAARFGDQTTVAERERRRDARLRPAGQGYRLAVRRRPRALPGQGARPQSCRTGDAGYGRSQCRRRRR